MIAAPRPPFPDVLRLNGRWRAAEPDTSSAQGRDSACRGGGMSPSELRRYSYRCVRNSSAAV
jgi:hypothetical protein